MNGYIQKDYTHIYFQLPGRDQPAEPPEKHPLEAALRQLFIFPRRELDPDTFQANDCRLKYQPAFKDWLRQYQSGAAVPTVNVYLQHTPEPGNPYPGGAVGIVYEDPMLGAVCTQCHHAIGRQAQCRCQPEDGHGGQTAVLAPARTYPTVDGEPAGEPGQLASQHHVAIAEHIPTTSHRELQEAHTRAFGPPARQKTLGPVIVPELEAAAKTDPGAAVPNSNQ